MSEYKLKFTPDQAKEIPMVDVAFEILRAANTPFYYRDLMNEIAKVKGLSEQEALDVIAQVYTEINIDGRFACVGQNLWGLKRWYPVEKGDEAVGGSKRPRIINDDDDEDEDELYTEEDLDENYDADREDGVDFDTLDEDRDEFYEEEEEEVEEDLSDDEDAAEPDDLEEEADDLDSEEDAEELDEEDFKDK